jgi:hypothetical protein
MESNMTLMKKLECELILDWQRLQMETTPEIKSVALKAYYVKFEIYRKARAWSLELLSQI